MVIQAENNVAKKNFIERIGKRNLVIACAVLLIGAAVWVNWLFFAGEEDGFGGYRYFTDYLFSVDLNNGAEYGRELLWEKNLKNLESGTLGDPENPETLLRYWQSQERAHYPYARENVEYFNTLLAKKIKKEEEN